MELFSTPLELPNPAAEFELPQLEETTLDWLHFAAADGGEALEWGLEGLAGLEPTPEPGPANVTSPEPSSAAEYSPEPGPANDTSPESSSAAESSPEPAPAAPELTTEQWLDLLRDYYKKHESVPQPKYVTEGGNRLGAWLMRCRRDLHFGILPGDLFVQIIEACPVWRPFIRLSFGEWVKRLSDHYKKTGRQPACDELSPEGLSLGRWLRMCRLKFKKNDLEKDQCAALDKACPLWKHNAQRTTPNSAQFEEGVQLLREYYQTHGTPPKQTHKTKTGRSLGVWLDNRRRDYRNGTLSKARSAQLDKACPPWIARQTFDEGVRHLAAYYKLHRKAPKQSYKTECNWKLGVWLNNRRSEAKRRRLTSTSRAKLDKACPGWDQTGAPERHTFEEWVRELGRYYEKHGHRPPSSYVTESGWHLGDWITKRRQAYRRGRLPPPRCAQIDAACPDWREERPQVAHSFAGWLAKLRAYVEAHGALPPAKYITDDGWNLGGWLSNRRASIKKCYLTEGQRQLLDRVYPGWDVEGRRKMRSFEDWLKRVSLYVQTHGAPPPPCYVDNEGWNLSAWLSDRRRDYERGVLKEERQVALDLACPGWLPKDVVSFSERIVQLRQYYEQHRVVPYTAEAAAGGLGEWAADIRHIMRSKRYPSLRRAQLAAACPGWNWAKRTADMRDES